jgi:hypothetical protein
MACASIGEANPDIAGIGVSDLELRVYAKADGLDQILAAFTVQSLIAVFVSGYTFLLSSIIERRLQKLDPNSARTKLDGYGPAWLIAVTNRRIALENAILEKFWNFFLPFQEKQEPTKLFRAYEWIVGKQWDLPVQRTAMPYLEGEVTPTTKRLQFANRILLAGNDAQTFTGSCCQSL